MPNQPVRDKEGVPKENGTAFSDKTGPTNRNGSCNFLSFPNSLIRARNRFVKMGRQISVGILTRTLDNSNLSLTRTNFHFPSSNFVYNFTLDNSNNVFQDVTSKKIDIDYSPAGRSVLEKTVPEVLDTQDTWVFKTVGVVFPIWTDLGW